MARQRPLRVVHLAKWAPPVRGGMETIVRELAAAMAHRSDVDVEYCCYSDRDQTRATAPNVTLRRFRAETVVASAPVSLSLLVHWFRVRRTVDVVHVDIPNPWPALLLLLPTKAAVVVAVHAASSGHRMLRRPHDALVARLLERADAIVASARANATLFDLDRHGEKVHVVPYGIDPARLDDPGPAGVGDPPVSEVLFVGRRAEPESCRGA